MGSLSPAWPVQSNRVLEMNRGNTFGYTYSLGRGREFPLYTGDGVLVFSNTYGQVLDTWYGVVDGGNITFLEEASKADVLEATTAWTLSVEIEGQPRLLAQGTVIRTEAPFPDAPSNSDEFDGVHYEYSFGTPGLLLDPAWRVLDGHPRVYDNSFVSLPNAVGAGSLLGGDLAVYDDVAMLWFAPVNNDPVRLTYNTIRIVEGSVWVVICSNYDMTNYAAIKHTGVWASGVFAHDTVQIVTGTGPVTTVNRGSPVNHTTSTNETYTAEYNAITNTYSLYLGSDLDPLVEWEDATEIVNHGEGERYVGFGFRSSLLEPGIEVSDWIIADTP